MLREARHDLLREKRKAKRHWQCEYTEKCKKEDLILNPKEAWSMVFKLMDNKSYLKKISSPNWELKPKMQMITRKS